MFFARVGPGRGRRWRDGVLELSRWSQSHDREAQLSLVACHEALYDLARPLQQRLRLTRAVVDRETLASVHLVQPPVHAHEAHEVRVHITGHSRLARSSRLFVEGLDTVVLIEVSGALVGGQRVRAIEELVDVGAGEYVQIGVRLAVEYGVKNSDCATSYREDY